MPVPLLDLLTLARDGFDRRLRAVGDRDWPRPTPCGEWTVWHVVNHVVGQGYRMADLLRGGSHEEYVRVRDDDFVGGDPVGSWSRGRQTFDAVLAEPGALVRTVRYRSEPTSGEALVGVRIFELTVHTWDLARGVGEDGTLDEELVQGALDVLPFAPLVGEHFAAPPGAVNGTMRAQERLLRMSGRSSGHSGPA